MRQCAFLSMDSLADFECYDELLYTPMAERGWKVEPVSWRAVGVDWDRFQAVVIRSTWDYQDDPQAFLRVLNCIERSTARLENPLQLVRWNLHKSYLSALERRGVEIVPTLWRKAFEPTQCDHFFSDLASEEIVIKPVVSANADNTYRLSPAAAIRRKRELERVFGQRELMIQPFLPSIVKEGEYSLFFFGGEYSHSILKTPKRGDFRVQEEHGGRLRSIEPEPKLLGSAVQTMAAVQPQPLYARADFARIDNAFALMELELIEPSLYFNMDPDAASRFTEAFVARMKATVKV